MKYHYLGNPHINKLVVYYSEVKAEVGFQKTKTNIEHIIYAHELNMVQNPDRLYYEIILYIYTICFL
jgi:hypothetical protein